MVCDAGAMPSIAPSAAMIPSAHKPPGRHFDDGPGAETFMNAKAVARCKADPGIVCPA